MDFLMFKDSVGQNKVHRLGEGEELALTVVEPTYLLKTSGSTGQKSYLHRLSDIQKAVDSFLEVFPLSSADCWGACLSTKHVAGFSILARSYFGKLKDPYLFSWSLESLLEEIEKNKITVLSLVPTQVFDLVSKKVEAPKGLKYIFVGGSYISPSLFKKAKELGWPLIGCYGSTETFAQMSYSTDGESLLSFPNWEVSLSEEEEVLLSGPGLYWAELDDGEVKVRESSVLATGDHGLIQDETFKILGKLGGKIKIKGSYFDFNSFKKEFLRGLEKYNVDLKDCFPVALAEERNGAGIYLITTKKVSEVDTLLKQYPIFRGVFNLHSNLFSEIGKPSKTKLEDVLLRTVVSL